MPPLGITGSTGRLGGRVARLLAAAGVEQRLLCRSPERAPDLPGTHVVRATYDDPEAVRRALDGLETVLMVSAAESEHRVEEHRAFVDAAVDAGVRHLVYTSFHGAAPDATFTHVRDHFHTEQHVKASGLRWTFLRDNLYADFFPLMADDDGVIRGPADGGRAAAVAQDDIAECAERVLLAPAEHADRTYTLTGPEALTLDEAAATMTRELGRTYRFEDESLEEAYASRAVYGAPSWLVDAWVSTYTAIAAGELEQVTDDVRLLTGHPPIPLTEVLARQRDGRG